MLRFSLYTNKDISLSDLRIALIESLIARKRRDRLILRIEDANTPKDSVRKEQEAQEIIKKFAINFEQIIYQSEHIGRYQHLAIKLLENKKAFLCTCELDNNCYKNCKDNIDTKSIGDIKEKKIPFSIRLNRAKEDIVFKDSIKGDISISPDEIGEFVIFKSDSTPSSDFACAIDDMIEGIDLVIQEDRDMIKSAREIHIWQSLGFDKNIEYAHIPTLLNKNKTELSIPIKELLEEGFLPDAIINNLLSIGIKRDKKIFTLPDALEWFKLEEISLKPVFFDKKELQYLNKEHLRRIDNLTLSKIFGFADADIGKLAKIYLDESITIKNLEGRIREIFAPKRCRDVDKERIRELSKLILSAPMFDSFEDFKNYLIDKSKIQEDELLKILSQLITGRDDSSKLEEIYDCIKPYITEIAKCQP